MKQPVDPGGNFPGIVAISEPPAIRDLVIDRLRETIITGGFAEGERLRQERIAETLGVSRMPVRDAIQALEAEGLLTGIRGGGAQVPVLDEKEIRDMLGIRRVLEPRVLEILFDGRLRTVFPPSPSTVEAFKGEARRHGRFHRALSQATDDRFLISSLTPVWATLERLVVRLPNFPVELGRLDASLHRVVQLGQSERAKSMLEEELTILESWAEHALHAPTTAAERVS